MRAPSSAFTVICFAAALIAPDRAEMFAGLKRICTQSGQVVKRLFLIRLTAAYPERF